MRCTILAIGSRGDVQPLIALGAGLRAAGLAVRVATHADFSPAVTAHGLEFFPLEGSAAAFFGGAAGNAFRERVRSPSDFRRFFDNYLSLFFERFLANAWEASRDADVVLSWSRCAPSLAERLRVPVFVVSLNPVLHLPTAAFANPFQSEPPSAPTPPRTRRTWRLGLPITRIGESALNTWRRTSLGLARVGWRTDLARLRRLPHLLGYSASLLPRPADWAPWVHVPGYWFLDDDGRFTPPPGLEAFLDAGPPPVAIGFSSQVGKHVASVTRAIVDGVGAARERAVVITGFGGITRAEWPPHVFPVGAVPYDWLCRRVSAMVHHGGAGSTAAAVRAGLPNVAVPFGFDQMLWGQRLAALGCGPDPIPADALTADALACALGRLTQDPGMRARAEALGARIRAEAGVGAAVQLVLSSLT